MLLYITYVAESLHDYAFTLYPTLNNFKMPIEIEGIWYTEGSKEQSHLKNIEINNSLLNLK